MLINFFKNVLAISLLFFCVTIIQAQNKKEVILDNFKKANSKTLFKGDWYTFSDKGDKGGSTIQTHYKKDPSGNQFFEYNYLLQKEKWPWTPYVSLTCKIDSKQIPLGIQAIAYEFKGSEHSFLYRSGDIKDFAFYQKVIPASKEWTTVVVPLSVLSQPVWGKSAKFHPEELNGFSWEVRGQDNDSGSVAIDNVRLLYMPQHSLFNASEKNQINIGHTEVFHSKLMNEDRGLSIYLPVPIEQMRARNKVYPVIYLLDGDGHIKSLASTIQQLGETFGNSALPEMIIIGIHNTNRWRDLSPSHTDKTIFGHSAARLAETGGGEKFMDFIEKELIPHVDSVYTTAPYKILIGHSLGGLTAINTLIHRPKLFNAYLAIDPSLWWDNQLLLKQADKALNTLKLENKQLFIATANTIHKGVDTNKVKSDTSKVSLHMRSIYEFTNILKKHSSSGLRWKNVYYENDTHNSVPVIADYEGLRYFFDYYMTNFGDLLEKPGFNIDSAYTTHYKIISEKLGYKVIAPEDMINRLAYYFLEGNKQLNASLLLFQMNVKNYPGSANAFDSLGEYYEVTGDKNKAIECYKKSLAIKEWPYVRKKLDKLEALK